LEFPTTLLKKWLFLTVIKPDVSIETPKESLSTYVTPCENVKKKVEKQKRANNSSFLINI
jgi:hypothetical protein